MIPASPFRLFINPAHGTPGSVVLPEAGFRRARAAIAAWPGYALSPLVCLPGAASAAGLGALVVKDETARFGLGSFKALGGAYAVAEALADARARTPDGAFTVTAATDGNHGRAVAWGARLAGAACVIFLHEAVSPDRAAAIAAEGAHLRIVPGSYDDAVREAARAAAEEGFLLISDTSWPGYTEVPRRVMQGYRVMAEEALSQCAAPPTHVFVQAGVGGLAAAVSAQCRAQIAPPPSLIVVEPTGAACLLESAMAGAATALPTAPETLMAGLACGEPSLLAWQELGRAARAFMAVPDTVIGPALLLLARAGVTAGDSAVAGLAGALLAAADPDARAALGLDGQSRVLVFATEGATDPVRYAALTGFAPGTVPAD